MDTTRGPGQRKQSDQRGQPSPDVQRYAHPAELKQACERGCTPQDVSQAQHANPIENNRWIRGKRRRRIIHKTRPRSNFTDCYEGVDVTEGTTTPDLRQGKHPGTRGWTNSRERWTHHNTYLPSSLPTYLFVFHRVDVVTLSLYVATSRLKQRTEHCSHMPRLLVVSLFSTWCLRHYILVDT